MQTKMQMTRLSAELWQAEFVFSQWYLDLMNQLGGWIGPFWGDGGDGASWDPVVLSCLESTS